MRDPAWHISYGNPNKKLILLRTFGTHRPTSSPMNARRSNIWVEGRPTRPGEGVPGRTAKSRKNKGDENPVRLWLKIERFHGFFSFSLRGDSRRPPTAIRQPPRIPLKNPPRNTSWARKCHTRPWRIVVLTRVCVENFPNTLFENGTVLALRKINSDLLAPSQAQISGS